MATASITGDSDDKAQGADDLVEGGFDEHIPIGDRLVENVDHRHVADIGIGAGPEAQLVGMRGEPDVDRQHPELAQHLQQALLRRNRQGENDEIEPRAPGEFDQFVNAAELRETRDDIGRARVGAVVEDAKDAQIAVVLSGERAQHGFGRRAAADDRGAPIELALPRQRAHEGGEREALGHQRGEAEEIPAGEPDARELAVELQKELQAPARRRRQGSIRSGF